MFNDQKESFEYKFISINEKVTISSIRSPDGKSGILKIHM